VLLVEDEPVVRMFLNETLQNLGCTTLDAADAGAALKLVQSGADIDLLVTDVGLPGDMDGRQLADAAREIRPGLKVLFITGYAPKAAFGRGLLDDGMEMMPKPFTPDEIAARISGILQRARGDLRPPA
jgi:CheY-like chemotaxis protein